MTETWLLNETITSALAEQTVNFVSSGSEFVGIKSIAVTSGFELKYYVQQGSSTTDLPAYDTTNGWLDTTYRTITFSIPPTGDLLTWIQANGNKQVSRKSYDLSTSAKWATLSSGNHNVQIVAKASGYRDSEPSAAVSVTKGPQEYTDCITFTGESSDFTLSIVGGKEWDGTVEYSTDHNTWTTWDGSEISSSGQKLYLRGSGNTKFWTSKGAQLSLSKRAACSGNIQTLLEYSNPPTSIPTAHCYESMFYDCTSLTQAPALPATTLADFCYNAMFKFCTSLTTAPELPATTLATWCYDNMFYGCTSLTQAPALPATTLADFCYNAMLSRCTNLKISSAKSSEYPTAWRIPSSGEISSTPTLWSFDMLSDTGGTFTSDPNINTTYYGAW